MMRCYRPLKAEDIKIKGQTIVSYNTVEVLITYSVFTIDRPQRKNSSHQSER